MGIEGPYTYPLLQSYKPAAVGGVVDGMPRYPSLSSGGILRGFDYLGTIVFAVSGSITAGSCGLDVFGASVVGTITAIGGGTVRDSIILHKQPFWVNEVEYLYMAFFALLLFSLGRLPNETKLLRTKVGEGCALWLGNSLGVGTFAIVGAMNACRMCVHRPCCCSWGSYCNFWWINPRYVVVCPVSGQGAHTVVIQIYAQLLRLVQVRT